MGLMEYKAKELFDRYDIPKMKGIVIYDLEDLETKSQV